MLIAIACWILFINICTFLLFGEDKRRARAGERRIPENDLLVSTLIGGTAGAYAGRAYFRHKTRKEPFCTMLHVKAMAQAGLSIGFAAPSSILS